MAGEIAALISIIELEELRSYRRNLRMKPNKVCGYIKIENV